MKKKFFMIMKHSSVFGIISILGIMMVASGCHNPKGSALSDFKIEVVPGEDTLRVSDWFSSINEITLSAKSMRLFVLETIIMQVASSTILTKMATLLKVNHWFLNLMKPVD